MTNSTAIARMLHGLTRSCCRKLHWNGHTPPINHICRTAGKGSGHCHGCCELRGEKNGNLLCWTAEMKNSSKLEEKTKDDYRVLAKLIGNVVIVVVVVSTVEATFPFRFCARCSLSLSPVGAGAGVGGERVLYFLPLLLKVLVASVPVVPALAPAVRGMAGEVVAVYPDAECPYVLMSTDFHESAKEG
ncbi:MAG: hypothetical protein JOS17DRAFT_807330 [Linnemannia elongata]|nr:MAG: hypothetical protein JOS17DRAFT_807330 [Linnemannia elongata]